MSTQAPVREERQTRIPSEIAEEAATGAEQRVLFERDQARVRRHSRTGTRVALAVMGATTLMSLGALLGARFIGRRVMRRGPTRVTGGSPTIVVMFPFTALNLYGRPPRRLTLPTLPRLPERLPERLRRFQRAPATR